MFYRFMVIEYTKKIPYGHMAKFVCAFPKINREKTVFYELSISGSLNHPMIEVLPP